MARNQFIAALANDPDPRKPAVAIQKPSDNLYDPNAAAQAKKLFGSAFADSMYALAGAPATVAEQYADTPAAGMYTLGRDSVTISPDVFGQTGRDMGIPQVGAPARGPEVGMTSPEGSFAHELAHRMLMRADLAGVMGYKYTKPGAAKLLADIKASDDSTRAAGGTIPRYAGTNYQEHGAEAVRNAIQLLRMTDKERANPDLAAQIEPLRQQFERAVPGTTMALHFLLTQPIYQGHPLRVSQDLKYPAPDATRAQPKGSASPTRLQMLNLAPSAQP